MKAIFFFIIGVFAGGYAVHVYDQRAAGGQPALSSDSASDAVSTRLRDWHLTSDDIRADLAKTGQVFRAKAAVAGEKISDVRILTVIKSKYVLDRDLSAREISVDVKDGAVVLSGSVSSEAFIGRATALALDTDGVRNVTSRIAVEPR